MLSGSLAKRSFVRTVFDYSSMREVLSVCSAQDRHLTSCSFRAVTETAMRKALRRVIDGECISIDEDMIDVVITNSNGDIRSAIHQLQFQHVILSQIKLPMADNDCRAPVLFQRSRRMRFVTKRSQCFTLWEEFFMRNLI